MKIFKRIIYTLLGIILAGTAVLVGVILYAEYSGNHFTKDSIPALAQTGFSEEESRLAYDENGNLLELPQSQPADTSSTDSGQANAAGTTADNAGASAGISADGTEPSMGTSADNTAAAPADTSGSPQTTAGATADTASNPAVDEVAAWNPAAASSYSPSDTGGEPEIAYVMDLGSALFHTPDCPYAANIAEEKRSEMTTTSAKIMNAGYNPCPHCHPDQVAAAATAAAASLSGSTEPSIDVSNELSP